MPASDIGATCTSGRRPKAFNEGTRGKWQAVAPRAPSAMEVCARRSCVRATDADERVG